MDYAAAELEFRRLEALRQAGQIDMARYREQLERIKVVDDAGRTWMLQEMTGQWFVLERGQWQAATPPGQAAASPPSPAPPNAAASTLGPIPMTVAAAQPPQKSVSPATKVMARQTRRRRPGCLGITLRLLLWALLWALAAWAVDSLVRTPPLWAYPAVGLGAILTVVLWVKWMTRFGRVARKGEQGGPQ